jgi:hypothetical protein
MAIGGRVILPGREAAITVARQTGCFGIDAIEIAQDFADRGVEAIEIKPVEGGTFLR